MSKMFIKYSIVIACFFVFIQIYLTISYYKEIKRDKNDLLKMEKIQKTLLNLKFNGKEYMAIAGVIDDSFTYAYGYTSKHRTQKSANKKALFYCEKKRKAIGIDKKCRLINSLLGTQ